MALPVPRSVRILLLLLAVASPALFLGRGAAADEGEWLPEQIAGLDFTALEARGLELGPDELWTGEEGLLSAAVQINGCSASFVSPEGLIVTNHHCGFAAINAASTLERNHLEDGFVAADREAEIPAEGYSVSFVRRYDDVTAEVHAAMEAAGDDPAARWQAVQAERRRLEQEVQGPFESAIVVPYFEGREWRRIVRTVLRDVRLVYAPPRDVGEYGGETDNWMWPRHTGDFTFFRAYVAPDGSPADYAPDNVPFRPDHWLRVSEDGVEEGDLVMVMGYPGRTNRYMTSVAVAVREAVYYPLRLEVFSAMIRFLEEDTADDPERRLRIESLLKGLANAQKNAEGMIWGLARNGVVDRKLREEAEIREWVAADAGRRQRYDGVLDRVLALDTEEAARMEHDFLLDQFRYRSGAFRRMLAAPDEASAARVAMSAVDRRILELLAGLARELPETQRLEAFDAWDTKHGDGELGPEAWAELARSLAPAYRELQDFRDRLAGLRLEVGPKWISLQEEWRGKRFYPDANSTLRLSIATVKGYQPRDGVWHLPFTTVAGMLEKDRGEGEFDVPDEVRAAAEARPEAQGIRVCFLADADTTGGNSGSPVVDGRGRLVGLNFDRVFENVAGDFGWNPERSRNISVDVRFPLWLMREVWPAPHLLEEMGLPTH